MSIASRVFGVCLIVLLIDPLAAVAGTTGKIAGRVVNKTTGESLPSTNIRIVGENLGSVSDVDGYYVILQIKPGTYQVKASLMGFSEQLVTEVQVRADLTTQVNFRIAESSIAFQEVVIKAERPMINKDETSRTSIVSSQTFSDLPVNSFQDIVGLQAGFTTGSDGELHARGGRGGEVAYLIDGVPVRDPLSGSFTGQIDKYAIEELQVLTGGFNAEYGQALSGVVNIVTKEGGSKLAGRVEYTSDQLNESPYHKADALALDEWGIDPNGALVQRVDNRGYNLVNDYPSAYRKQTLSGTPELGPEIDMLGQVSAMLNGPVPYIPELKFFLTGRYLNALDQLPWGYNKEREVNGKLTYGWNGMKINLSSQRFYRLYKPYAHQWKYLPEGYEVRKDYSWRDNLKLSHVLNAGTFYEVSASYQRRYFNRYEPGKYAVFSPDGQLLESNYLVKNSNTPPFWTNTDNGVYIRNEVETIILKGDFNSQLGQHNLVKTGIEVRQYSIDRLSYQEPYPSGFHAYEKYVKRPLEMSFYVQDKIEFEACIINAGVRYDYVEVDDSRWASLREPAGYVNDQKMWIPLGEVSTPSKHQVSPRIGIAFPMSDKTVFYSSYGHFFQLPDYVDMYTLRDPTLDGAIVGNPGIAAQKTVAFEFGVKHRIANDYTIDLSAYFKDITNLTGSTYLTVFPYEYTVFDNSNYGGVQGFEIGLNKRLNDYWFANVNYTYSVAKGNESDPREGYNDYRRASALLRPKRVFALAFDREHVFYGTFGLEFPKDFGPSLFGVCPLENFSLNVVVRASSGLPYTPQAPDESNTLLIEKNSGRMPADQRVDLRISRMFPMADIKFTFFAIINNAFDNINALNVWATSGYPLDAGPTYSRTRDRMNVPGNVDIRRSIQAGIRLDF
ncbi:MAG: TonB-dependent receptor [Ignavibacteriales bacterium]|nr:TonB-dependent receptor [Ignavibacteriales bacterium]